MVAEMAEVDDRWRRGAYRAVEVERQATHEDLRHGGSLSFVDAVVGGPHRDRCRRGKRPLVPVGSVVHDGFAVSFPHPNELNSSELEHAKIIRTQTGSSVWLADDWMDLTLLSPLRSHGSTRCQYNPRLAVAYHWETRPRHQRQHTARRLGQAPRHSAQISKMAIPGGVGMAKEQMIGQSVDFQPVTRDILPSLTAP